MTPRPFSTHWKALEASVPLAQLAGFDEQLCKASNDPKILLRFLDSFRGLCTPHGLESCP